MSPNGSPPLRFAQGDNPWILPVNSSNDPTKCAPPALVRGKRNGLLAGRYKMGAEDGAHTGGRTGALKLHRSVHSVGVGAGQGRESSPGGRLSQCLGTGDADSEGEVGVNVEVDHSPNA
jgi:hypothetical protein